MNAQLSPRANGFSLVEVIVATLVLTVGLLGAAGSAMVVSVQMRHSTLQTQRTHVKDRIIEELRATTYSDVQTNTTPRAIGSFGITWSVTLQPLSKQVTLVTTGPAYRAGQGTRTIVSDTTAFEILRP